MKYTQSFFVFITGVFLFIATDYFFHHSATKISVGLTGLSVVWLYESLSLLNIKFLKVPENRFCIGLSFMGIPLIFNINFQNQSQQLITVFFLFLVIIFMSSGIYRSMFPKKEVIQTSKLKL